MEQAEIRLEDGTVVSGEAVELGNGVTGFGKIEVSDGSVYIGPLRSCRRHGTGFFQHTTGAVYVGDFDDGARDGFGTLIYASNDADVQPCYSGGWLRDRRHGAGICIHPSGAVYDGNWKNDEKSGVGNIFWVNKNRNEQFVGEWRGGVQHGYGIHTWYATPRGHAASRLRLLSSSHADIDGVNASLPLSDMLSCWAGRPTQVFASAEEIQRFQHPDAQQLRVALQQHIHTLVLSGRYRGGFKHGKRDGFGVFEYANGASFRGYWQADLKHGPGVYTATDGSVFFAFFTEDKPVVSGTVDHLVNAAFTSTFKQFGGTALLTPIVPGAAPSEKLLYQLRINDLLASAGKDVGPAVREIINVLTRWNTHLKGWYKSYAEAPIGAIQLLTMEPAVPATDAQSTAHACQFDTDGSMPLGGNPMRLCQLWKFVHDCGLLIPGSLHLADVDQLLLRIRAGEAAAAIRAVVGLDAAEEKESWEQSPPQRQVETKSQIITSIIRRYAMHIRYAHDPLCPVYMREFVELLIRIAHIRLKLQGVESRVQDTSPGRPTSKLSLLVKDAAASGPEMLSPRSAAGSESFSMRSTSQLDKRQSTTNMRSGRTTSKSSIPPSGIVSNSLTAIGEPPQHLPEPGAPDELASALHCMLWYRVSIHVCDAATDVESRKSPFVDALREALLARNELSGTICNDVAAALARWLSGVLQQNLSQLADVGHIKDLLAASNLDGLRTNSGILLASLGLHESDFDSLMEGSVFPGVELANPTAEDACTVLRLGEPTCTSLALDAALDIMSSAGLLERRVTLSEMELPVTAPVAAAPAPAVPEKASKGSARPPSTGKGAPPKSASNKLLPTSSKAQILADTEEKSPFDSCKTFGTTSSTVNSFRAACEQEILSAPILDSFIACAALARSCVPIDALKAAQPDHAGAAAGRSERQSGDAPLGSIPADSRESAAEISLHVDADPLVTINVLESPTGMFGGEPSFALHTPFINPSPAASPQGTRPASAKDTISTRATTPSTASHVSKVGAAYLAPIATEGTLESHSACSHTPGGRLIQLTSTTGSPACTVEECGEYRLTPCDLLEAMLRVVAAKGDIIERRRSWIPKARNALSAAYEAAKTGALLEVETWYKGVEAAQESLAATDVHDPKGKPGTASAKSVSKPSSASSKKITKATEPEENNDPEPIRIAKSDVDRVLDETYRKCMMVVDHVASLQHAATGVIEFPEEGSLPPSAGTVDVATETAESKIASADESAPPVLAVAKERVTWTATMLSALLQEGFNSVQHCLT